MTGGEEESKQDTNVQNNRDQKGNALTREREPERDREGGWGSVVKTMQGG